MTRIPFSYSLRNLWARRLTTLFTAGGMAMVVFVFAAVLMLDQGLRQALVQTGSFDNVVVIRKGSETEVQSSLTRDQASLLAAQPQVATGAGGLRLASPEVLVLITLPKRDSGKVSNITVRGVPPQGIVLRPQVRMTGGRMFAAGSNEVVVGRSIARQFQGSELGSLLNFGGREWRVVGQFDAGGSGFDSEIWGDAEQFAQSFRRNDWSSLILRLTDPHSLPALQKAVEADPRLTVEIKREPQFYSDQSEMMSSFISVLGLSLSIIFSIGAIIGAMITMYAAVAQRVGEIGTLRALGFRRSSVLLAFLVESLLLSVLGGVVGVALASTLQAFTISTMNWQSFSELAFGFHLTAGIVIKSLVFAVVMGLLGGFLPALRASRMQIVEALRES